MKNAADYGFLPTAAPDVVKVLNSTLNGGTIRLLSSHADNAEYGKTHILLSGTTFASEGTQPLVICDEERSATLKIANSLVTGKDYKATIEGNINAAQSDIPIVHQEALKRY